MRSCPYTDSTDLLKLAQLGTIKELIGAPTSLSQQMKIELIIFGVSLIRRPNAGVLDLITNFAIVELRVFRNVSVHFNKLFVAEEIRQKDQYKLILSLAKLIRHLTLL